MQLTLFALLVAPLLAQTYYSVPGVDAPELAAFGTYTVGVRTVELVNPAQVDILQFDAKTKTAPSTDRRLKVEIWYPATLAPGEKDETVYESPMAGRGTKGTFQFPGKAKRDATPRTGAKFPLVIVSHGYPGSRTFLSYLTENLASKGYVVAAIDHTDSVFGEIRAFSSTLLNRSADQLFVLDSLSKQTQGLPIDATQAAIIGYSMGGYGALASGGAGYNPKSPVAGMIPGGYLEPWTAGNEKFTARRPANLKAIIAIAPWGAQMNSWDNQGLEGLTLPSLFIVGDQDDISGYEKGVKRAFEGARNSNRCMLVYQNARHNVGGNPAPAGVALDFAGRESFEEPVWRKDRILAINQHFATAFLDRYLKGDQTRDAYLHPGQKRAADAVWPASQTGPAGAKYSTGEGGYWKGFQRRWALGLEMHCYEAGTAATAQ
ncbi:MAG: hypothetical protein K2X03_23265 [Bryobacteraceae bacterium]|nr:hypothetical protein [Bryobacteraceae bacterium]